MDDRDQMDRPPQLEVFKDGFEQQKIKLQPDGRIRTSYLVDLLQVYRIGKLGGFGRETMVMFHRSTEGDGGRRRTSKNSHMWAEVDGRTDGRNPFVVAGNKNHLP